MNKEYLKNLENQLEEGNIDPERAIDALCDVLDYVLQLEEKIKILINEKFTPVSVRCREQHIQDCSHCEDANCGDNTNPTITELIKKVKNGKENT